MTGRREFIQDLGAGQEESAVKRNLALALWILLFAADVSADVKPSPLFSDHVVLQSGISVPVWGTADAGEKVTVTFQGQPEAAIASADGKWILRLKNLKPGGPFEMTIAAHNSITVKDVLIGEVWLGSGQSNMQFTVSKNRASFAGLINEEQEIAAADYPQIRMFTVKSSKTYEPQTELQGEWLICNPENVPGFSAVGYLFSRDLYRELKQPVGFITSAFGASTAESWIRRETMATDPLLKPMLDHFDAQVRFFRTKPDAPPDQAPQPPRTINARPGPPPQKQRDPVQDQHNPTVLFNGMINPLIPYAIRGVIWYQGESIVGGKEGVALYPHVQETLIKDWRALWNEGNFPFYVVQLAALQNHSNNPLVREGQAAVLSLKNTGLAVTIDIGDPKDVHPHNKAPLGERLTLIALANVYGRKIEYSGPVYESMRVADNAIRVKFSHAGGLMAKDGPLKWFVIAGADQKFLPAEAAIEGDTVVVRSAEVAAPVAVRYAWDNYPEGCNLYNGVGLPAAPFRTDRWAYDYTPAPQRTWQQITVPSANGIYVVNFGPARGMNPKYLSPEHLTLTKFAVEEDLRDYAKVRLNGVELPARAWQPYRWDVTTSAKAGRNTLEIEVRGSTPMRGPASAGARAPAPPITGILAPAPSRMERLDLLKGTQCELPAARQPQL